MDSPKKGEGCVVLKIALAYERGIHFEKVTAEQAERVFILKEEDITPDDISAFQDYLFCHTLLQTVYCTSLLKWHRVHSLYHAWFYCNNHFRICTFSRLWHDRCVACFSGG